METQNTYYYDENYYNQSKKHNKIKWIKILFYWTLPTIMYIFFVCAFSFTLIKEFLN